MRGHQDTASDLIREQVRCEKHRRAREQIDDALLKALDRPAATIDTVA